MIATPSPALTVTVTATWSDTALCDSPIASDRVEVELRDTAGGWHQLPGHTFTAPAGAASVDLAFAAGTATAQGYLVHFDHLSLLADVLFVDGFDAGDPAAWAAPAP
jgi:hypothetical protein